MIYSDLTLVSAILMRKLVGENAHHDYINMSKYKTGVYLLEFVKGNAKTVKRVIVK